MNTRTRLKAKWQTWNACRKICADVFTINLQTMELKNGSAKGWKKLSGSVLARVQKIRQRQRKNLELCTLAHPGAVILQNAAVHHHENARLARLFSRSLVNHVLLHPDRRNFELDRLIDNFFYKFRPSKDIHDVDLLGNIEYRRV